jgi:hypothetical protein
MVVVVVALAAVLAVPSEAMANGGAYLELDREHYLPGQQGVAETYVTVPERKEDIFDLGPFYLYVLPGGTTLREGQPIPSSAIRVGTFEAVEERHQWELTATFVVPEVTGDFYTLATCNDPCTITGFREALTGDISIVATAREASLLIENGRAWNKAYRWRRDARRAERLADRLAEDLAFEVTNGAEQREELTSEVGRLETQLAAAERRATEAESRPPLEPWVAAGIVALALVAAGLSFRRRRLLRVPPDDHIEPMPSVSIHSARVHELDRR